MNKKIAIVGAGGHGKVIGEIAELNQYNTINFFDDNKNEIKEFPFTVSGSIKNLEENFQNYDDFVAIGENQIRFKIIQLLKKKN